MHIWDNYSLICNVKNDTCRLKIYINVQGVTNTNVYLFELIVSVQKLLYLTSGKDGFNLTTHV